MFGKITIMLYVSQLNKMIILDVAMQGCQWEGFWRCTQVISFNWCYVWNVKNTDKEFQYFAMHSRIMNWKLYLTTEKKILNISRTKSSQPMSSISKQHLRVAIISNILTLQAKNGLSISAKSLKVQMMSLKTPCKYN